MERSELIEKIKENCPGTPLRHALDDIQDANVGGLLFLLTTTKIQSFNADRIPSKLSVQSEQTL